MSDTPMNTAALQAAYADNTTGNITPQLLRDFVVSVWNTVDYPVTAFGQSLADSANAAAARTTLGLGTAAVVNTGTGASNAILGNDSRLSDSRTPVAHAASHASGGSDAVTITEAQVTNLVTDLAAKAPIASPTFTGTATGTFSGNGSALTSLNGSNISSGTVPTARLGSGTASSSTFLRGDQTYAAPASSWVGTATSDLNMAENNITSVGNLTCGTAQINGDVIFDSGGGNTIQFDGGGNTTVCGNCTVDGQLLVNQAVTLAYNQINDSSASPAITFDGSANTTVNGTLKVGGSPTSPSAIQDSSGNPVLNFDGFGGLSMNAFSTTNQVVVGGFLQVIGNQIQDSNNNVAITLDGSGNTAVNGLTVNSSATLSGITVSGQCNITNSSVTMGSLPTSDPANAGQLWNNSGVLTVSAG
jgi:hypothetical protein